MISAIDVASQSNSPGWTLGKWAGYWSTESASRDKVRNVISLEVSGTKLADEILPPRLVREMDWVEKYWPNNKKGSGQVYPKVQLYCLMGVAGAWTVRISVLLTSQSHNGLTSRVGLAHRLRWLVSVLPYTPRFEGMFIDAS